MCQESLNEQIASEVDGNGVLRSQRAGTPRIDDNGFRDCCQGLCGDDEAFTGMHSQEATTNVEGQLLDLAS